MLLMIVLSSEAGVRGYADMAQYAMTKAAQINLTRSLAGLTRGTGEQLSKHCSTA
jgi:NAD(P)-dependent dehydrogenase (short-subunit alcohol dehydrogenase family)